MKSWTPLALGHRLRQEPECYGLPRIMIQAAPSKVPPLHMPLSRSGQELRSFFYPPQKRTRCSDFQAMRTVRKAFSAFSAADPEPTFGLVRSAVDFCIIVFMSRT